MWNLLVVYLPTVRYPKFITPEQQQIIAESRFNRERLHPLEAQLERLQAQRNLRSTEARKSGFIDGQLAI